MADIWYEAAYGKDIKLGSQLASAFELLYKQSPRLTGIDPTNNNPLPTIEENNAHVARRRIYTMIRSNVRDPTIVQVNDEVYLWRDNIGWIGPARVSKVEKNGIEAWHNGSLKTASHNRVRRLEKPHDSPTDNVYQNQQPTEHVINQDYENIFPLDNDDDDTTCEMSPSSPNQNNTQINTYDDSNSLTIAQRNPEEENAAISTVQTPALPPRTMRHNIPQSEIRRLTTEGEAFIKNSKTMDQTQTVNCPAETNIPGIPRTRSQSALNNVEPHPTHPPSPSKYFSQQADATTEKGNNMSDANASLQNQNENCPTTYASASPRQHHIITNNSLIHAPEEPLQTRQVMITSAEKLAAFAQERNSWIKNKAYIRVDRSSVP